eukprot:53293-Alexandrium_andersonii.AAC.1
MPPGARPQAPITGAGQSGIGRSGRHLKGSTPGRLPAGPTRTRATQPATGGTGRRLSLIHI